MAAPTTEMAGEAAGEGQLTLDEQITQTPSHLIDQVVNQEKKMDEEYAVKSPPKKSGHVKRASNAPYVPTPSFDRYKHATVMGKEILKSDFDIDEDQEPPDDSGRDDWFFHDPKAKKPRVLLLDGKLKRISEIDTAAETFRCRMHYYLTWLATRDEVEGFYKSKLERHNPSGEPWFPDFVPKLQILNKVDGEHELNEDSGLKMKTGSSFKNVTKLEIFNSWPKDVAVPKVSWDMPAEAIGFDPRYGYWLRVQYEVDCVCAEELELEFFPFDCQDFGLHMSCSEKVNKLELLPFPRKGCYFSVDARFSMVGEWYIPGVVIEFSHSGMSKVGLPYAGVSLRVKAERKWHTHMANLLITFCMFFLGLGMFAIHPTEIGDRLGYAMTLVLADVATLQLMFDSMPSIPYETFMDTYTYGCFIFLVVQTVYSCFAGYHGEEGSNFLNTNEDEIFFGCFFLAFLFLHLFFIFYVRRRRQVERTKLWMTGAQVDSFYSHAGSDSVTVMPHCECKWDSETMLSTVENEIASKDFPDQSTDDQEELAEFEREVVRRRNSASQSRRTLTVSPENQAPK